MAHLVRVTIFTMGTRGDVEPAVALGIGLSARGHTVTVASHECFQGDIERRGLGFRRLPGDPERLFDHPAWSQWQPSAWRPLTHARLLRTVLAPLGEQITQDHFASAMEDTDAVLFTLTTSGAYDLAQERGLPCVGLRYTPLSPTRCFAHPALFPTSRSGGWENLLSYPIAERLFDEQFR